MLTLSTASAGAGHLPTVRFTLGGGPNSQTDIAGLPAPLCASLLVEDTFYEQSRNVQGETSGAGWRATLPLAGPQQTRVPVGYTDRSEWIWEIYVTALDRGSFPKISRLDQEISAARCRGDSEMVASEFWRRLALGGNAIGARSCATESLAGLRRAER
jgi:hypothetical protein